MPTEIDIYGKGNRISDGSLKSNNPALTAALDEAYNTWNSSKKTQTTGDKRDGYGKVTYGISEEEAVKRAFEKAGVDPKLIPKGVDLDAYNNLLQYNGVGADPLRTLALAARYEDGRSKNEAGRRDANAWALANGKTDAEVQKFADRYESDHEGWIDKNIADVRNAALLAAAVATGGAAAGAWGGGAAAGGAAAGGTAASGLAGTLGMSAGYGATALNAGALNAGMTLARGGNIGDALKAGATGAVLAPIAGMTSNAVGGGITGALAGGAAQGGVGAALTGKDVMTGIRNGTVNAGVGMIGNAAGNEAGSVAKDYGLGELSKNIGSAVSAGTRAAVTGKDVGSALVGNLASQGMNALSSKDNSLISGFNGGIDTQDLTPNAFDAPYNRSDWEDTSKNTQGVNMGEDDEFWSVSGETFGPNMTGDDQGNEDANDAYWSSRDIGGANTWSSDTTSSMDQELAGRQGQIGNLDGTGASDSSTDFFGSILKGLGLGTSSIGSAVKSVGSWLGAKENSDISRVILGGLSTALSNNSSTDRVKLQNQGAIDLLNEKDRLKREEERRYNDSWLGSQQPTGMIAARPLTRMDGTRVFGTGAGMINRG